MVASWYKGVFGWLGGPFVEAKKEQVVMEKLLRIKEIKRKRDIQLSIRIATLRDRVRFNLKLWMAHILTHVGMVDGSVLCDHERGYSGQDGSSPPVFAASSECRPYRAGALPCGLPS